MNSNWAHPFFLSSRCEEKGSFTVVKITTSKCFSLKYFSCDQENLEPNEKLE